MEIIGQLLPLALYVALLCGFYVVFIRTVNFVCKPEIGAKIIKVFKVLFFAYVGLMAVVLVMGFILGMLNGM